MRNQPKYHFLKNTAYAIAGLKDLIKTEKSFKIELWCSMVLIPLIILLDFELMYQLLMFVTLMGVLIAEAINSAIERNVDLVTLEHHQLAKRAKDMGSAIVFLSILTCGLTWIVILIDAFG